MKSLPPFKRILYPVFFVLAVLVSFAFLMGMLYLYTFIFRKFGEVLVIIATLTTFVWLANLAESSGSFQKLKNWFLN